MNTSRYAASGLLVSLVLTLHVNVTAQDAGTMEPVSFSMPSGQVQMKFRFCPSGTVRPGMPDPNAVAQSTSPVSVRGFYIGETEVTGEAHLKILDRKLVKPAVVQSLHPQRVNRFHLVTLRAQGNDELARKILVQPDFHAGCSSC